MNKISFKHVLQVLLPFCLGIGIIGWIYRDLDFDEVWDVLKTQTKWSWMIASLFFGLLSHIIRGLRWVLALEPLGIKPKKSNAIYAIFTSYAVNLVVPRLGEFTRCGVLSKYDGISFSKSFGSVVAERMVDSFCAILILLLAVILQGGYFINFFNETGFVIPYEDLLKSKFFYLSLLCVIGVVGVLFFFVRKLALMGRIKRILINMWEGMIALVKMKNGGLYILFSVLIWSCYFLHFYLTFFCFPFTADLGPLAGLALFIVGSFAVVVPTPNGAGPWHFVVITLMTIYGISVANAGIFALIVHTIQSFLVVLLGTYGFVALPLSNKKLLNNEDNTSFKS